MESDKLKENIQKKVKENIAISNIREELEIVEKNSKLVYVGIGMCAVIIIGVFIIVGNIQIDNNIVNNEMAQNNEFTDNIEQENSIVLPIATVKIELNADIASYAQINPKYILAVKVNKIKGYTNYSKILDSYMTMPITIFEAEVLKSYKGNIAGNIDICCAGGTITISDFEKSFTSEQKEKRTYYKLTDEEKESTYVEVVTSLNLDMDKVEEGNIYFVCLVEDTSVYNMLSATGVYGMKKLNLENDTINEFGKETSVYDLVGLKEILNK